MRRCRGAMRRSRARRRSTLAVLVKEIAESERDAWTGKISERPFVLLVQPSLFDPSRAPAGKHTVVGVLPRAARIDRRHADGHRAADRTLCARFPRSHSCAACHDACRSRTPQPEPRRRRHRHGGHGSPTDDRASDVATGTGRHGAASTSARPRRLPASACMACADIMRRAARFETSLALNHSSLILPESLILNPSSSNPGIAERFNDSSIQRSGFEDQRFSDSVISD